MRQISSLPIKQILAAGLILLITLAGCVKSDQSILFYTTSDDPMIEFGIEELKNVFTLNEISFQEGTDQNADVKLILEDDIKNMKQEGFKLSKLPGDKIQITASDPAGAMYGLLELAEQVKISGMDGVSEKTGNPYMELRGTKFNIPLDIRTPTYTDPCDATLNNMLEMWNFDFWKEYIDNLARYRYNYISLWSLHPFPSMVKVPGYEDVALDNIERSTIEWDEFYSLNATDLDKSEIVENTEVVRKMSIEEKIEFWKKVMAYGKSRNVDFYIVTWNIFVNGTDGKYGITDDINNPVTRDYFRKTIREMFLTYPDLAGIGLTTGENMHGANSEEREDWAFDSYAKGLLEIAEEQPDRKFTFIHRQHQTMAKDIAEKFKPIFDQLNIEFLFSFKYAKAHVMSTTTQPYHEQFVKDIEGMKTIWTLRNDDNYIYRWGAPDFVREFIQNIPYEVSRGFYYGSDQWVWGREFLSKELEESRQIEIVKHWYHWMLWGRLGYDPYIENERFIQILQERFPEINGEALFKAWQNASMIYPVTTGFHWGPLDFQWYIEACKSHPGYAQNETGFHDVNRFINLPPHPESGFQSIPEYVKLLGTEDDISGLKSPFEVSDMLHSYADKAISFVNNQVEVENEELEMILHDIKTMATLGKYYAFKIAGSTNLAIYREKGKKEYQNKAVEDLQKALEEWKTYTKLSAEKYKNPLWTNRVGYVNWDNLTEWAEDDIAIARGENE